MKTGPVFTSQIKKLRKRYCWVDQPLCRSSLTPISCTKLKIHSAHVHVDSPGFKKTFLCTEIYCSKLKKQQQRKKELKLGPVFASEIKKLRKRYCWVDQPLCRSGLTPISCTKLKIHSAHVHVDSPGF